MKNNFVRIGKEKTAANSIKEAVKIWTTFRDQNCLGASESPAVTAVVGGVRFRISYNGRCWSSADGSEILP